MGDKPIKRRTFSTLFTEFDQLNRDRGTVDALRDVRLSPYRVNYAHR
jgi:hypothetical protein